MDTSRRRFLHIATTVTGLMVVRTFAAPSDGTEDTLPPPVFSIEGGRYESAQNLTLQGPAGATIHYTLDGTRPTPASPVYCETLKITASANVTALAVKGDETSRPVIQGYMIKQPGAHSTVVVLSDIHTSVYDATARKRWRSHFDTLHRFAPNAQVIVSNGDQINDNGNKTGADHLVVRKLFQENIGRLGLAKTEIAMVLGNHDDSSEAMAKHYPKAWYPGGEKGYYEKTVGTGRLLFTNTEKYSDEQRSWLKGRLKELTTQDGLKKPVIVFGHRPLPGTVFGGAQSSNRALYDDLAEYPQVIFISGHSHLLVNDQASIHQKHFTAVNDGSMSYTEVPHNAYQVSAEGAVWEDFTLTTAQGLIVDTYAGRVEIQRLNYYAEQDQTYVGGKWTGPGSKSSPNAASTLAGAGTLAGACWTIALTGDTPDAIRQSYAYTAGNDAGAPKPGAAPEVVKTKDGPALRIPQATDDRYVYGYEILVTDAKTGEAALPFKAGRYVESSFHLAPVPDAILVPLKFRSGRSGPVAALKRGREYKFTITAVDAHGNRATPVTLETTVA